MTNQTSPSSNAQSETPSLSISNLQKSYGNIHILKDINVDISPGDFLVLVGPSGCGKSTLLNCIGGLTDVTEGSIHIGGREVTHVNPADREIAMVFQSYALFPNMKVGENMGFGLELRKVPLAERQNRIHSVAQMLNIDSLLDRYPSQLSGGQRQRVAMGRALVRNPQLFLFDEPLSNLDAKLRVSMRTEIKRLHERLGATMVYVTHDQIEAMTLATKILVLKDGIIQQAGTPHEIYNKPANIFVAGFMGAPSMNLMDATITLRDDAALLTIQRDDQPAIELVDLSPPAALRDQAGKVVTIGLRPEALSDEPRRTSDTPQRVKCQIEVVEPAGSDTFAVMHMGGAEIIARLHGDSEVEVGDQIDICFDLAKISYFDKQSGVRL